MLIHYSMHQTELKRGNTEDVDNSFEKFCHKEVGVHWGESKCREK